MAIDEQNNIVEGTVLQEVEHINFSNRALQYGDGVFETLRIQEGKILFWEDHYFRLMASMRILRMQIPLSFTPEHLQEHILQKVQALDTVSARVKLVVFRDSDGLYLPTEHKTAFFTQVIARDFSAYEILEKPQEIGLFKDHYVQKLSLIHI